ncbi:STAS domain-containing protein [Streptomyces sp. NPDC001315]|uniref:STAS domain-containing protein n=1 Tax=Streptomyces sp. NPDC001315 TaxID=3364562 RepID=UPI00368548C5
MTFLPTSCRVHDLPGCTLFTLPPEIDFSNAGPLFDAVAAAVHVRRGRLPMLVLDLTETHFIDSQGARLVDDVRRLLGPRTPLRVAASPRGLPRRVLELTGVRRDVPVYDDLTEALSA